MASLSKDLNWFPTWALWFVLPWLALHLYNDFSVGRALKAQRKPGEPPAPRGAMFGLTKYAEIMRETTRRYENRDTLARAVTYYDLAMAGAFVVYLVYRMYLRWGV
jgi:hypothetical protein